MKQLVGVDRGTQGIKQVPLLQWGDAFEHLYILIRQSFTTIGRWRFSSFHSFCTGHSMLKHSSSIAVAAQPIFEPC
ncbi:hypothetical protein HRG84_18700 [Flavisolibacter sp. BT320]|nr:hypothetical protein [Flavisolibacter longurius]